MRIKPKHQLLWVSLAGILPLLLCIIFTFIEARQAVKRQLVVTASMLLTQAENVSDLAWQMTDRLQALTHRQCTDVKSLLQEYGNLYPYFRSVGITHGERIACSSAFGASNSSLETVIMQPLPAHRLAQWSLSIAGSSNVKNRPAVLFMRNNPDGTGSFALVDGQYLIDFMHAAGVRRGYHITLSFNDGYRIVSGGAQPQQPGAEGAQVTASSARYPIATRISSPYSETLKSWYQVFFTFLPMAIILSLLLIALTLNWLKRKNAFRDEIRRGIDQREFFVCYQPLYNLSNGRFDGVEALMRWQRADGSFVPPDAFIAAAEAEQMIVPLTRHLLALMAKDCDGWRVPPGFHIGINVAAEHLQHADFVSDIRGFAAKLAHLKPAITLEITERSLISDDVAVAEKLETLRAQGMCIAIDDFGTGHCSLSYLQTFPLDYLKIDKGFVNTIESVEGETPVLDAIINLAHRLQLRVVAEGVETQLQLDYLKNHGVSFIQGYYFARPMDSASLMTWLAQQESANPRE